MVFGESLRAPYLELILPLYTYHCASCGFKEISFRKINERDALKVCENNHPMRRLIEAPSVRPDLPGYESPIDGRWIEGRVARNEDFKRSNSRPWEGMENEKKEAIRRSKEVDQVFEKQIEAGIAEVYNGMSAENQRALQNL